MNIYVRYFNNEALLHTPEEVVEYLKKLNDFNVTREIESLVYDYYKGNMPYAKRCHVRPGTYFLLIKSMAGTLEEFKAHKKPTETPQTAEKKGKEIKAEQLEDVKEGWYRCTIKFKRVVLIPGTEKNHYQDTVFSAYVHGKSAIDCYNRILNHLKNRQDIDPRSQFPSPKGNNYKFEYVSENTPVKQNKANVQTNTPNA